MENLSVLIAATFTPMKEDGRLDLAKIPNVVEKLISEGINGLYVVVAQVKVLHSPVMSEKQRQMLLSKQPRAVSQ